MYRTDLWTLWEKARVGCFKRTASKHLYYLGWNRSPAQVGCMRQALGPGALGRPRGIGWIGSWEGGSGTHVNPWLIHFNVWQKPLQCCKVISLQLIKINEKKKLKEFMHFWYVQISKLRWFLKNKNYYAVGICVRLCARQKEDSREFFPHKACDKVRLTIS